MNELGWTLVWSSVRVTLVLVPVLATYALATRRGGPATASWAATFGLALVVVLTLGVVLPTPRLRPWEITPEPERAAVAPDHPIGRDEPREVGAAATLHTGLALWRPGASALWARLGRGAALPAARVRPWGGVLAAAALGGTGLALARLLLGLWAVHLCRRRGVRIDDPGLAALVDSLRVAMGCRRPVELREVAGVTTPATAGWRKPVLMLPDDWRAWDAADLRAVVAHELAHVVRHDYAAGLLARLAVALQFHHPLVRWVAGRLQLEQELAADALGARFAGGRGPYLAALSRLALRQDGRSPAWPARTFLPARGTLIRRIAMLTERETNDVRPWSAARRGLAGLLLAAAAAGVGTLRRPALADDAAAPPKPEASGVVVKGQSVPSAMEPIELIHVPEDAPGFVAFRPAAALGRPEMAAYAEHLWKEFILGLAQELGLGRPGRLTPRFEDVAWVTCSLSLGQTRENGKPDGRKMHSLAFGSPTIRMVRPFDWLACLRQWGLELTEEREGARTFYKVGGKVAPLLGPLASAVYLPDDRTIVFDAEPTVRKLLRDGRPPLPSYVRNLLRDGRPPLPSYLAGPEWRRLAEGSLLAVAIDNHDARLAKAYDIGRRDDQEYVTLAILKGTERVYFSASDAGALALRCEVVGKDAATAAGLANTLQALVAQARKAVEKPDPNAPTNEVEVRARRMTTALLSNVQVSAEDARTVLTTRGFGSLADLAALIEADAGAKTAQNPKDPAATRVKR